jgi:hypothetical protein
VEIIAYGKQPPDARGGQQRTVHLAGVEDALLYASGAGVIAAPVASQKRCK